MSAEVVVGDFELTMTELRTVARYVVASAEEVLPHFEDTHPQDRRPRAAIDAAWEFIDGSARTNLQRVASLDAHRAARAATTEIAKLAARCAGDAASAAYLHPIAKATQLGHVLRAPASAARITELLANGDLEVGAHEIERAAGRASSLLIDVVTRYPRVAKGTSRVSRLMSDLDARLRDSPVGGRSTQET